MKYLILILSFLSFFLFSCDNRNIPEEAFLFEFPEHFPDPIIPNEEIFLEIDFA